MLRYKIPPFYCFVKVCDGLDCPLGVVRAAVVCGLAGHAYYSVVPVAAHLNISIITKCSSVATRTLKGTIM